MGHHCSLDLLVLAILVCCRVTWPKFVEQHIASWYLPWLGSWNSCHARYRLYPDQWRKLDARAAHLALVAQGNLQRRNAAIFRSYWEMVVGKSQLKIMVVDIQGYGWILVLDSVNFMNPRWMSHWLVPPCAHTMGSSFDRPKECWKTSKKIIGSMVPPLIALLCGLAGQLGW